MGRGSWTETEEYLIDTSVENGTFMEENTHSGSDLIQRAVERDPRIENRLLKKVFDYKIANKKWYIPMRSYFPREYLFPPVESLTSERLAEKLQDIRNILATHHIELRFVNNLPNGILYRHLVNECIPDEMIPPPEITGCTSVLDGCNGVCEECFQKEYCLTAQELLTVVQVLGASNAQ